MDIVIDKYNKSEISDEQAGIDLINVIIENQNKSNINSFFDFLKKWFCEVVKNSKEDYLNKVSEYVMNNEGHFNSSFNYASASILIFEQYLFNEYETPSFMFARVALHMSSGIFDLFKMFFDEMIRKHYILSSATCFNSLDKSQLSSCFLTTINNDDIFETAKNLNSIVKDGGGVSVCLNSLNSSNFTSKLIFLQSVMNIDMQNNKRKAVLACYLDIFNFKIEEFLNSKRSNGYKSGSARDLMYCVMIPDFFFELIEQDGDLYLFDTIETNYLTQFFGLELEQRYNVLVSKQMFKKKISAKKMCEMIIKCMHETGNPYLLLKDNINRSNMQKFGTITTSNLCTEIVQYHDVDEIAVCNLATINLSSMINEEKQFDYVKFSKTVRSAIFFLNQVCNLTKSDVEKANYGNRKQRAIGLGVCGLSDLFQLCGLKHDSSCETLEFNRIIFLEMYLNSVELSLEYSKKFDIRVESKYSDGILHFDFYNVEILNEYKLRIEKLRGEMIENKGIANSLLVALMPTATSSNILNVSECFLPRFSNKITKNKKSGQYIVYNPVCDKSLIDSKGFVKNNPIFKTIEEINFDDVI